MTSDNKGPDTVVDIKDLTFRYGSRVIVDKLSLTIPRGKVVAIMGGSGCGKTTLLNLIGGRIKPDSGTLVVGPSRPCTSQSANWTPLNRC